MYDSSLQFQRLADILYATAKEQGNVDPHKIEKILYTIHCPGILEDVHVLELAQKFTNMSDLRTLALIGLKLKGYSVDATLHDNDKAIQEAAYKVLQEWIKRQKNKQKAYTKLLAALRKAGFDFMATELQESVENLESSSSTSSSDDN